MTASHTLTRVYLSPALQSWHGIELLGLFLWTGFVFLIPVFLLRRRYYSHRLSLDDPSGRVED